MTTEIEDMIAGHELAIELEQVVIAHLEPARIAFRADDRDPDTMRRLRQILDSERTVRDLKRVLAVYRMAAKNEEATA